MNQKETAIKIVGGMAIIGIISGIIMVYDVAKKAIEEIDEEDNSEI